MMLSSSSSSSVNFCFKSLLLQNNMPDLFQTLHNNGRHNGPQFYGEFFQFLTVSNRMTATNRRCPARGQSLIRGSVITGLTVSQDEMLQNYSETCLEQPLWKDHPICKDHFQIKYFYLPLNCRQTEPVWNDHLSRKITFSWHLGLSFQTGFTVHELVQGHHML